MPPYDVLLVALAVLCGLVAGVFVAFSTFVMPALARLPDAEGHRAMQSVNVAALTPVFMTLLFGTAALAVVTGGWAATRGDLPVVGAADLWRRYLRTWVGWNHLRALTATAACLLLVLTLAQR